MFDPKVRTNFVEDADRYGARIIKIMSCPLSGFFGLVRFFPNGGSGSVSV